MAAFLQLYYCTMKYFIFIFSMLLSFGCGNNVNNSSTKDPMDSIEDHPVQDTSVAPFPDGYAPPNTKIDSSEKTKDSVRNRKSK